MKKAPFKNRSPQIKSPKVYPFFYRGADISSLQRSEEMGARYFDEKGVEMDALTILQEHGVNSIRLRVWVDPVNGSNSRERVVQFAKKLRARNLKLLIDLHFSDTWADPLHQVKPAAWIGHTREQLQGDVFNHTREVVGSLIAAGAAPDMAQVGNEINPGFLLPDGSVSNWDALSSLLKQGCSAVKSCSPDIQVMLHLANAGDLAGASTWFDQAVSHGVQWDVIGLSYYSYWHSTHQKMMETVREMISRYHKPVVIVETAYPFTMLGNDEEKNSVHSPDQLPKGYPATPEGQARNLRDVIQAARQSGATGVFYWEPTWITVEGNGWNPADPKSGNQWENQALFDFEGKVLPAMEEFNS